MNYYERHIGDWIKDTVALSMVEDGAYNRLVDQCYQLEGPLPKEKSEVYRLARANTPAERKAVDYVLPKYFEQREDGWHQKRIASEIERFRIKQGKARASANARWSGRDGNADPHADAMRTHSEGNALQSPDTSNTVPDGTGADAPKTAAKRAKGDGDPVKREIWETGRQLLERRGSTPEQAGSVLGKLIKDHGQPVVLEAVRAAAVADPMDPVEYITAACLRANGRRLSPVAGTQAGRIAQAHQGLDDYEAELRGQLQPGGPNAADDAVIDADARRTG